MRFECNMNTFADYKRMGMMIAFIVLGRLMLVSGQHLMENLIPSSNTTEVITARTEDISRGDNKVKRFERLTVPLGGSLLVQHPIHYGFGYSVPVWQVGGKIVGAEAESMIEGMITFQQLLYNPGIKVTLNVSGLPVGKHALHIHTFGDISDGCKSTGGQFPNNFIGNADAKDDGTISVAFRSHYLNLFGFSGIVGRSIVIHDKPIDLNTALNAEVLSSFIPDVIAYQNEENSVGPAIACGVISIMSTNQMQKK